jgi:antitoxin HigA-1
MTKRLAPVHPGEILVEDFLTPVGPTPSAVARAIGVPRTRIERLARQETALTADTALRLARFFGVIPAFWMHIQAQYDLERAQDAAARDIARITPHHHEAA